MKRSCLIALALITILLLSGLFIFKGIYSFLTPVKTLPAQIFVLEGWAQDKNLETAAREFTSHDYQCFLVTAYPYSELLVMGWEGKLAFRLHRPLKPGRAHMLNITLSGTQASGEYARFRIYVNDSLVGADATARNEKSFVFQLPASTPVDHVEVAFINDAVDNDEDRNLIVHNLRIDNELCDLSNCTMEYSRKNDSGESMIVPLFSSYALQAKHYLSAYGIDDSLIIPISADTLIRSRTYSTALAVKDYLSRSGMSCDALMIMSYGVHSRRSYISYKKAFGKETQIGIIASQDVEVRNDNWFKSRAGRRKIFREVTGVLYAFIFL